MISKDDFAKAHDQLVSMASDLVASLPPSCQKLSQEELIRSSMVVRKYVAEIGRDEGEG